MVNFQKCYIKSMQSKKIQLTTIFQIVDIMECDICGESFACQNDFLDHGLESGHGLNNDSEMIGKMHLFDKGKLESMININFLEKRIDEEMSDSESNMEVDNVENVESNNMEVDNVLAEKKRKSDNYLSNNVH